MKTAEEKEKEFDELVKNHGELKNDYLEAVKLIPAEKPKEQSSDVRESNFNDIFNNWKSRVVK